MASGVGPTDMSTAFTSEVVAAEIHTHVACHNSGNSGHLHMFILGWFPADGKKQRPYIN